MFHCWLHTEFGGWQGLQSAMLTIILITVLPELIWQICFEKSQSLLYVLVTFLCCFLVFFPAKIQILPEKDLWRLFFNILVFKKLFDIEEKWCLDTWNLTPFRETLSMCTYCAWAHTIKILNIKFVFWNDISKNCKFIQNWFKK